MKRLLTWIRWACFIALLAGGLTGLPAQAHKTANSFVTFTGNGEYFTSNVHHGQLVQDKDDLDSEQYQIIRRFDKITHKYAPGHRGVDLALQEGEKVKAVQAGEVFFAGQVGGKGVISIIHPDQTKTTYQPVTPTVKKGQRVAKGAFLGVLEDGHCEGQPCLHLGWKIGQHYLDPTLLLFKPKIRLLPEDAKSQPFYGQLLADLTHTNLPKISSVRNPIWPKVTIGLTPV